MNAKHSMKKMIYNVKGNPKIILLCHEAAAGCCNRRVGLSGLKLNKGRSRHSLSCRTDMILVHVK